MHHLISSVLSLLFLAGIALLSISFINWTNPIETVTRIQDWSFIRLFSIVWIVSLTLASMKIDVMYD